MRQPNLYPVPQQDSTVNGIGASLDCSTWVKQEQMVPDSQWERGYFSVTLTPGPLLLSGDMGWLVNDQLVNCSSTGTGLLRTLSDWKQQDQTGKEP